MVLRFAGFQLDSDRAELRGPGGGAVRLRPKTFEMLRLFVANAGRVVSKQELMEAVWPNVHVGEDNLFQCIREIRTALDDEQRQLIRLVSGRGYLFSADVSEEPDGAAVRADAPLPAEAASGGPRAPAEAASGRTGPPKTLFGLRHPVVVAAAASLCAVIALAAAAQVWRPELAFRRGPPIVAVLPIVDASGDPRGATMAAEITGRLTDGFARIDNIRVLEPRSQTPAARLQQASASSASSDFQIHGELQRDRQSWVLRTRMVRTATGEVQSVATISVDVDEPDTQRLQMRLAAGVGHPLARRLNELLDAGDSAPTSGDAPASGAKVAIEQASAAINQTSHERFGTAQAMLRTALAAEPDNVDVGVALAALQMRGIQMRWYSADEAVVAKAQAGATLERALRARPNSIAVLETYCRLQSATYRFAESLVTCARALSFDPWNGLALYLVGLGQLYLGRFEDALATFRQADRFDTPTVSRWTWLLGAGWANLMMGRGEDALPWLERSIAITPATGRSHMLLAAAYQQAGRVGDARAAMQEGLRLIPGTTAQNVAPPQTNASPVYVQAAAPIIQLMVAAGLPER
jgi:DNA-binding winged helix-turn-helix (wHTH) protein/tetratricopeptide (TPR) repeat protein